MIIACPNCAQKYNLSPDILAGSLGYARDGQVGWWLSCGYCDYQWWHGEQEPTILDFPIPMRVQELPERLSTGATPQFPAEDRLYKKSIPNGFQNLDSKMRDERPKCTEEDARKQFPKLFSTEISENQILKGEGYNNRSWILSFISIFIIALSLSGVGYLYKEPLVLFWYKTLGKPSLPIIKPLLLQNVSYTLQKAPLNGDDSQILTITGEMVNLNSVLMSVPVLRISIWADCQGTTTETVSPSGDCLYLEWVFKPNNTHIDKTSCLPFETSYPVSAKVRRVEVAIP